MSLSAAKIGRKLLWLAVGCLLVLLAAVLLRTPLTGAAIKSGLHRVGAEDVSFDVVRAAPWDIALEHLAFRLDEQPFTAQRISFYRPHWWRSSLGAVRIEGAQIPVNIARLGRHLRAPASSPGEAPAAGGAPSQIPAEEISIDGKLTLLLPGDEQPLAVKFEARPAGNDTWSGSVKATGSGLALDATAAYEPTAGRLDFRVTTVALDLKIWQTFIREVVALPGGTWGLAGQLTGRAAGTYADGKLAAGGHAALRNGHLELKEKRFVADGVEADFDFTDLVPVHSKPGTLWVRELHVGDFAANHAAFEVAFESADYAVVSRAELHTLGGRVAAEPFKLALGRPELDATVLMDDLDVAQILALAKDVPAEASGRVDGRVSVRLDATGLRLGTGWLELKKGVRAEVRLRAAGLLTGGMKPGGAGYSVMKRIEDGLLQLHVGELRLDVRSPDAPAGQSARLHLTGEPVDPSVKAPVTLDVNVNGPIEQLINFGLNENVSFGPKH
jgi:hypothetical protein